MLNQYLLSYDLFKIGKFYFENLSKNDFSSQNNPIKSPVGKIIVLLQTCIHWKIQTIVKLIKDKDEYFY